MLLRWEDRYDNKPKGRFRRYRSVAKQRGVRFTITWEEFLGLWQKPCAYCGGSIRTIGLDRVNNLKGYTRSNVVSCCYDCNSAKGKRDPADWIQRCRQISRRHG